MNTSFVYIIIILIMFLWTMRTNKKNQQQAQKLQDSLRPGMYVMLKDGLYGTIVDVMDEDVVINFSVDGADEGCLTVGKSGIYNVVEDGAAAQPQTESGTASAAAAPESIEERVKRAEQLKIAEEDEAEITDEHAGEPELTENAEPDTLAAENADTAGDDAEAADAKDESAAEDKEEC